ncbi:hypothetical protein SPRG_21666 [Saprolegnia parasitica CBS 223.65]|uniref:SAM-dependent MTase RsmB/NOP-type domain-containing protein n=1 Tax=Saprolegnia parasitica (strain CBS 223.65) TaxID=695850 RepID=A0A067BVH4_SAPPC|nr:hypothetical protein SPRG_21666 [Saprolegnia parasitica CBS 223.65]KDO18612.1 hypothetical protein SPRG_21666 [Saprolegnia parasitica CBS 223.65]|eukprot:XP_012210680.1 hypothetical protein SPRG_21666 [Saprolegnia parasitica CBS 223.65]
MNVYNAAAAVVDKVRTKHSGIRTALYALPISHGLRPTIQALAQESLKHADALVAGASALAARLALANPSSSVVAFERAPARATSLRNTVAKAGANDRISVVEADFLETDMTKGPWADATLAICDPSCSGSGNVAVGEPMPEHSADELTAFADHQFAIVQQAMALPKMQTVVYSTCSVHEVENEGVVARLLKTHGANWALVSVLPNWPERGVETDALAPRVTKRCVRASHAQHTHGFFVSCFERRSAEVEPVPMPSRKRPVEAVAAPTTAPKKKKQKKKKQKTKQTNTNDA